MIVITGRVVGSRLSIAHYPSDPYMKDVHGNKVVGAPIYADLTPDGDGWKMNVTLPDNTELLTPADNQWVWMVEEDSDSGRVRFTIPSDPATYTYAAIRPRRGAWAR